jgi:hypothetical protein
MKVIFTIKNQGKMTNQNGGVEKEFAKADLYLMPAIMSLKRKNIHMIQKIKSVNH